MKPANKFKIWALILLLFGIFSSCRTPEDDYHFEENDEPSTALSQFN